MCIGKFDRQKWLINQQEHLEIKIVLKKKNTQFFHFKLYIYLKKNLLDNVFKTQLLTYGDKCPCSIHFNFHNDWQNIFDITDSGEDSKSWTPWSVVSKFIYLSL